MTHPNQDPRVIAWTEDELDDALAELGSYEPPASQIAAVRARVVAEPALATVSSISRRPRSRRKRRLLVAGVVALVCGVGGGVAAAAGVFDQQVTDAFATGYTYPYHIDASTAVQRVSTTTPDGGQAQYWTAKRGDILCGAPLLDDPGKTPPGKPYQPQAICNDGLEPNGRSFWESAKTGAWYMLYYGRVDADAVTATFINPVDGAKTTTQPNQGYYIIFLPYIREPGGDYGINTTKSDGSTTTIQKPLLLPPGTGG